MIPQLHPEQSLDKNVQMFLQALRGGSFSGDINADYANRLINATDNSIYQLMPQAVLAPKTEADIASVMALLGESRFNAITLTPRGGGTGTNGQALNHSIVLDCSKYMRAILDFDAESQQITVEPGVILDQLNAFLKPYGLFFPPTLSPSNRATIGGMVATDACGKGSRIYGKTSDYIQWLDIYLTNGDKWGMHTYPTQDVPPMRHDDSRIGAIVARLDDIARDYGEKITATLPEMNREFSGYNLADIYDVNGDFSPTQIIAGSEGTLGVISSITLRLLPIPKHRQLVVLCYNDFDATLRAAPHLLTFDPLAIETFDGIVFQLARNDNVWHKVKKFMPQAHAAENVGGCNLIEFVGDSATEVAAAANKLLADTGAAFHVATTTDAAEIQSLWELRKRGVGLLGNMKGDKRPVPFAEDTAVPPENLADYIAEYRALLDAEGVEYGMFGHVDTGCLHVRPALNLRDAADEARIRVISNKVVTLVKRYGGLMWGEHGKGFRAEYTPEFIGEELYACLRDIKAAFDPHDQLNPGKIATASGGTTQLYSIDNIPLRGHFDKEIQSEALVQFPKAVECNGNGACFNYDPNDAMCPSYKATGNRLYSPKGRAGLMREWLRQLSLNGYDITAKKHSRATKRSAKEDDFSHVVYDSMKNCLACKACAGQCPIKVDIPDMRAQFLALYHSRYPRRMRDYLIGYSEELGKLSAAMPKTFSAVQTLIPFSVLGMVDTPKPSSPNLQTLLAHNRAKKPSKNAPAVTIIQDAYTSFYDAEVVRDMVVLLYTLGINAQVAQFKRNGKSRHVMGFLHSFNTIARQNAAYVKKLSQASPALIGVDASVTLTYRQEYMQNMGETDVPTIFMLQEWLAERIEAKSLERYKNRCKGEYYLFSHCTESTSLPQSAHLWKKIFTHFGLTLHNVATGCCGMAGTFGHMEENQKISRNLYEMSWQEPIAKAGANAAVTGYSCRCQVERYTDNRPLHPAQILLHALEAI
ncbi:MAG: FAD-binding oxidoreductase [Alphaproteobacteria bacterium]|nr:FAD-binding oxidoreductase [Alphaproteobacteria bacterium]